MKTLQPQPYPILEYDPTSDPIVCPSAYNKLLEPRRFIKRAIITYFTDVVDMLERGQRLNQVFRLRMEGYRPRVYEKKVGSEYIYVIPAPLGAPQAARLLECLADIGVKKFMICGGAGTFCPEFTEEHVLVPTSAVRDEGTSYHYLPPSREVKMHAPVREIIIETLKEEKIEFREVKTWTTDAIFRETAAKVEMRKAEGCHVVEMECSAYLAVAEHKKFKCGQLLYAGDVVATSGWDYRDWHTRTECRARLFDAAEKCLLKL